jgi:hypothetical protein
MKRFPLIFFLITGFLAFTTYAQDDTYKIRLSGVSSTILLKGYYVERVINAQDDDTIIGFVQTGVFNKKRLVSFNTCIADEIGNYLKVVLPKTEDAVPLIVRVNKLNIFEVTDLNRETAYLELNLSFIRRDGSRYYHLFDAGTFIEQRDLIDVTHTHPENIVHGMVACFVDLRNALLTNRVDNLELSEKELSFNPLKDPSLYPIFHAGKIPKGVFRTFYDFRDCNADTHVPFEIQLKLKKDTSQSKVVLSCSSGADSFWGFSDGNFLYKRIGKYYYKLYPKQQAFISYVTSKELSTDYAMAGYMAGLLGVLMVAAFERNIDEGTFRVDFYNGSLTPYSKPELKELYSKTVFAVSGSTDPTKSICLFVDNKFDIVMKGGQYYTLYLPPRAKKAVIELRIDSLHYTNTIFLNPFVSSLYYLHISKKKEILMELKTDDLKTALMNGMSDDNTIYKDGKGSVECNH